MVFTFCFQVKVGRYSGIFSLGDKCTYNLLSFDVIRSLKLSLNFILHRVFERYIFCNGSVHQHRVHGQRGKPIHCNVNLDWINLEPIQPAFIHPV